MEALIFTHPSAPHLTFEIEDIKENTMLITVKDTQGHEGKFTLRGSEVKPTAPNAQG